ncbi:MAG: AAA family ATPase [Saprospiraceae bacterium]|nr:AAA family ATPase [Saprospiraceae bacterium]
MAFRFSQIKIEQVGPFGDLLLQFKPNPQPGKAEIHILTGENGTGKTTILELLAGSFHNHTPNEFLTKSKNKSAKAKITFNDNDYLPSECIFDGQPPRLGQPSFIHDYLRKRSDRNAIYSFAVFAYSGYRQLSNAQISGIQEISQHPLDDALQFQRTSNPQILLQWIANTIAAEAIAISQNEQEEATSRRKSIATLEEGIGAIIQKKIAFRLETKPYAVRIEIDGERLDFNQLPDGLKSIISWLGDLLMRMDRLAWKDDTPALERNFILFLDEIEVHLHPDWQRKILPAIQFLFPNAQIFISTHSPFVVGSVDDAWVYKLVKPNGDSHLAEGFPVLSKDEKTYDYWLELVFDIDTPYGLNAAKKYERRSELLRKKEINPTEMAELKELDRDFELFHSQETPLNVRISEHLKRLKSNPSTR